MAEYPKVKKAKAYKEELHKIIEQYLEEKDDIVINSGQLKFFRGLMVRYIAVSTNIKVQKPSTRIFEFFDNYVCGSNDEVIDLFDHDKNMKGFFESVYCEDSPFSDPFETEYATIPFLLLQKLQNVMEECFREYLRIDGEEQREKKEDAYFELLLSVALYEIFIRELYIEIEDKLFDENAYEFDGKEDFEELEKIWESIKSGGKSELYEDKIKTLTTHAIQSYEKLLRYSFKPYYIFYFVMHLINLYAVLRIIVLIERVQINKGHGYAKTEKGRLAASEADYWFELMGKLLKNGSLFFGVPRKSNLGTMYALVNAVYERNQIFPHIERNIKYWDFEKEVVFDVDPLKKYFDMLQKHTVFYRTDAEEKMMWDWQAQLAAPLWRAANDIMKTVENVKESKEEKHTKKAKNKEA